MEEKNKEPKIPKTIPKLEYKKPRKSEIILSIVFIIFYFSDFLVARIIPSYISVIAARIIVFTYYIGLYIFAIICCKNIIKEDVKLFKNNFAPYIKFLLVVYVITKVGAMVIMIFKVCLAGNGASTNQETLNQMPILFTAILAILWAPVVEETVFRISLRRFIKNDIVFIIISAVLFGTAHVLQEPTLFDAITNSIPYMFIGACLAYTYKRTNNGVCNVVLHGMYNLVDVILMAILL